MNEWIRVCDVEKYYGSKYNLTKAVDRVSFTVKKGEFIGIMGASGSGKSTLLNMMATIDQVTSGHIYYENQDVTAMKEDALADFRMQNLGFVFQNYNLLDNLTLKENMILAMTLNHSARKDIEPQVEKVMKMLGIWEIADKFPNEVSGGQRQRCACGRAIINEPRLILADEPTGALDSKSAQMLLETFQQLNEQMKATLLMVTHDVFSASYCSRILFLKDGQIFSELRRGEKDRRTFLNEILEVLSVTGAVSDKAADGKAGGETDVI